MSYIFSSTKLEKWAEQVLFENEEEGIWGSGEGIREERWPKQNIHL
jgi:hypothetical protein